jgi:hypothetical protein
VEKTAQGRQGRVSVEKTAQGRVSVKTAQGHRNTPLCLFLHFSVLIKRNAVPKQRQ